MVSHYNHRMILRRFLLSAALLSASVSIVVPTHAQSAITTDPAPDKQNPAAMQSFQLPSHGALLNALIYIAPGAGPHPTVILLHGFPGNEKNLDLAQTLRRAGCDVLYFNYRGSWGSPGDFSLTHSIEDTQSAIAFMRDPANAKKFRVDPSNIILIGHSMGGFMARYAAAQDPSIKAVALISAADMSVDTVESLKPEQRKAAVNPIAKDLAAEGMAPLAGVTPQSLAEEIVANADGWNVPNLAPKLATRPILVITSDDGLVPSNDAFLAALRKAGGRQATTLHLTTDHAYSDHRIALQQAILDFLSHQQQN
jgi:pimeloyl-ACP methyl ester carboxylesterase